MVKLQRLILRNHQSPGDILMLTAAVRDLHKAHPGLFLTNVETPCPALWENNPYLTHLSRRDKDVQVIDCHYPLIHSCNTRPYHFIHGFMQYLEERLGIGISPTEFKGDIHLSRQETAWMSQPEETGHRGRFWLIVAGGKYDFTCKWWNPASYQRVVDYFHGKMNFIQCGQAGHWHPPLKRVLNLVGRTDLRQFVRLMYHAEGVICPVTFAMHLAAAVPTRPGSPALRPCVVIAGGREPPHWEAYPHHQFLHTMAALPCCATKGCWKSRCHPAGDGDLKDSQNVCESPVDVSDTLRIPKCMHMITPEDVTRAVERYYEGGAWPPLGVAPWF